MSKSVLKTWKFWIGIAISGLFLYIAFKGVKLDDLIGVMGKINPMWILIGVGLYLINLAVRALRWQYIFRHVKPVSFWAMCGATLVGYFANNVLPMRLGEVARAVYVGQKENVDKSASLGTIAVERLFDIVFAVLVLALTFAIFPFPPELIGELSNHFRMAGQGLLLLAVVGMVSMFVMVRKREWTLKILDRVLSFLPDKPRKSIGKLAHSFIDGLDILTSPFEVLVLFLLSAAVWLTNLWPIWTAGMAFGVAGLAFNFTDQLFLLCAGAVAAAIPAAPGFAGTFHFATMKAVEIILIVKFAGGGVAATGITHGTFQDWGLSFAVLVHAMYILTTTSLGAIVLSLSGISFSRLQEEAAEQKSGEEENDNQNGSTT